MINTFSFQILESRIHHLYSSLNRSSSEIYKIVQKENNEKGLFDPKTIKLLNSENKEDFESFQDILRNLNNFIYFNSLLLGSYAIFEVVLIELCEFIEVHSSPRHDFERPEREILKECRKYLNDSGLLNLSNEEIDSKYCFFTKIGRVRNLIAHKNGNLNQDKSKLIINQKNYKLFKDIKELTILQNGQVYINNDELLKRFINDGYAFFNLIIKQLKGNNYNDIYT